MQLRIPQRPQFLLVIVSRKLHLFQFLARSPTIGGAAAIRPAPRGAVRSRRAALSLPCEVPCFLCEGAGPPPRG